MNEESRRNFFRAVRITLLLIGLLVVIHVLSYVLPLRSFGIRPRSFAGLAGIFTAPFIHASWQHLLANGGSFFFLGIIFFFLERRYPFIILMHFVILGGLGTWIIGRNSNHIGASVVIFGMIGYLIFFGIFKKELKAILVSILVVFLYGGAVLGLLSLDFSVSLEGHLSGFLAGIVTAWFYARKDLSERRS